MVGVTFFLSFIPQCASCPDQMRQARSAQNVSKHADSRIHGSSRGQNFLSQLLGSLTPKIGGQNRVFHANENVEYLNNSNKWSHSSYGRHVGTPMLRVQIHL